jgi:hydroxymethylglutaryl-CoA lyase
MGDAMTEKVALREVGMRDGLQNIKQFMATARKQAWCTAEVAAGMREMEVASLVPPKLIPQFGDAEQVVAHALKQPGLKVNALIPNLKGAERGVALGAHQLNYVLSVSEGHNKSNVRRTTQESIDDFRRIVALRDAQAKDMRPTLGCGLATSFGCTIEGKVDEKRVMQVAEDILAAGVDELMVADTVGYGDPAQVKRIFSQVLRLAGKVPVAAHFHNTRGLGLANVLAAVEVGVRRFDACLGGMGGCPYAPGATGNVVMEDTVFMLEQMGFDTGVDLPALLDVRKQVQADLPGVDFHGDVARAGLPKTWRGRLAAAAE